MQTAKFMQKLDAAVPERLTPEWLPQLPPLVISWQQEETLALPGVSSAPLHVCYGNTAFVFVAAYRKGWQERDFQASLVTSQTLVAGATLKTQGRTIADTVFPLIVLPYLSPEKIAELERRQLSGLDYCGNGVLIVADRWFIRSTGQPNRFRREQALQNPYLHKASLVGRALFAAPILRTLEDLHHDIVARGGSLSLAMVSRALRRLEEDVVTHAHKGYKVWLLQPEKLLDALQKAYAPQRGRLLWQGRVDVPDAALLPRLFANAQAVNRRAIVTGLGSATRYAALAMENTARIYVETVTPPELLLQGLKANPGPRFPNLEIYAAPDSAVYFDGALGKEGVVWASPLQTYLEMMQQGDSRMHDSATQVRARILDAAGQCQREREESVAKGT